MKNMLKVVAVLAIAAGVYAADATRFEDKTKEQKDADVAAVKALVADGTYCAEHGHTWRIGSETRFDPFDAARPDIYERTCSACGLRQRATLTKVVEVIK